MRKSARELASERGRKRESGRGQAWEPARGGKDMVQLETRDWGMEVQIINSSE